MQRKWKEKIAEEQAESGGGASRRFMQEPTTDQLQHMGICACMSHVNEYQIRPPQSDRTLDAHHSYGHYRERQLGPSPFLECTRCRCTPWQNVGALRWDGLPKCHHHHHYHLVDPCYYQGSPRRSEGRSPTSCIDVMKNMWEGSYSCDHRNSCHPDLGPHYCRVTPTLSKSLLTRVPGPLIEVKAAEEEEEEEKRAHGGEEVDLYALPASKSPSLLKTQKKKKKKKRAPNNVLLTPFPSSTRGLPCVLCHYCSRLLLLPPPSGTPHLPPPFVKLKCSYCLKVSTFSTRHLHKSASSTSTQSSGFPAPLIFCAASPTSCSAAATQQMPGCYTRPTPPDDVSEPPSPNGELTFDRNEIHDATKEQLLERNDAGGVETSNGNGIEYAWEGQLPEHGNSGIGETPNGICEHISMLNVGTESMANTQDDRHKLASQETTTMSSVQDWVDSHTLEIECGSDVQLREYPDLQNDSHQEIQKLDSHHHRPPLHEHFGYKNPMELLEKVFSSKDDEIKVRSETNSLASSSSSGVNASHGASIKCASFHGQSPSMQGLRGSKIKNNTTLTRRSIETEQEDAQRSMVGILKRVVRDITVRSGQSSVKARVIVNGHMLSDLALKQAEERAGKLHPGSFWYDCKAGFWGVQGGPCLGILPPFIEELSYPMSSNCSNGDTQVYVNGRELHSKDLTVLSQRGLSKKPGRAYALGFDGILADETTGLELKPLGKLAPTVERKGKGFGMFTSDMVQRKTCDAHQIKPATSSD